jgi:segregation and condensation protein A
MIAAETVGIHPYQLRLPSFEGPMDVLLRLVERSQLQITDVSLIEVTNQFLAHIATMNKQDADLIAEFSNVGSRLVVLKSRSLLPKPAVVYEELVSDLTQELIEYQAFKEMALLLGSKDALGMGAYPLGGGVVAAIPRGDMPLAEHQPSQLLRALRRRLSATQPVPMIVVARKLVSLRDMAERVLNELRGGKATNFRTVISRCTDYNEVRTAFLAVLVLARRNVVDVEQAHLFGDIAIRSVSTVSVHDSFLAGFSRDEQVM